MAVTQNIKITNTKDIAVVVTARDEVKAIKALLMSLIKQSVKASEIIIVDGGSIDGTVEKVESISSLYPTANITVLSNKGLNRSQGRNLGIATAKAEIIAVTDAGCTARSHWLEMITEPIINNVSEVVAGFYTMTGSSQWQTTFGLYLGVIPDKLKVDSFLPSSRSIAFTKNIWQKSGGYPEDLSTCEDLVYAVRLAKLTTIVTVPEAQVVWRLPETLRDFWHQVKNYSRGDIEAGYLPHINKIISIWMRYVVALWWWWWILPLFYLYKIMILHKYVTRQDWWRIVVVQIISDTAVLTGSILGIWGRLGWRRRK